MYIYVCSNPPGNIPWSFFSYLLQKYKKKTKKMFKRPLHKYTPLPLAITTSKACYLLTEEKYVKSRLKLKFFPL